MKEKRLKHQAKRTNKVYAKLSHNLPQKHQEPHPLEAGSDSCRICFRMKVAVTLGNTFISQRKESPYNRMNVLSKTQ
jgi:hypothetical protein